MSGAWEIQEQVLVAILTRETVSTAWAVGFRNLIIPGTFTVLTGMPFDHARNTGCQKLIEMDWDWIFFLDDDVIPPPDAIPRLLAHRKPIVSGLYYRRVEPLVPVMLKNINGGRQFITNFKAPDLLEVDYVGAGCLLIHRDVLLSLPPIVEGKSHWFAWQFDRTDLEQRDRMSEDFAFCFTENAWIQGKTSNYIKDVKAGHRIINHNGRIQKVVDTICRPYVGDLVRLQTAYCGAINCTPGHRFYVRTTRKTGRTIHRQLVGWDGISRAVSAEMATKKTLWLEASQIQKGDWLYIPKIKNGLSRRTKWHLSHYISIKNLDRFPDNQVGYKRARKTSLKLKKTINMTEGLSRLIGYFLAEGSFISKRSGLQFAFHKDEVEYIEDCQSLLYSEFGAKSKLAYSKKTKGAVVYSCSKLLARLFAAWCGGRAENKHLPRDWMRLPENHLKELIKGYWRGDGDCRGVSFGMTTASERLANEVKSALLTLDILSSVKFLSNDCNGRFNIRIPTKLAPRFAEIIDYPTTNWVEQDSYTFLRETKNHFLIKVRAVETYHYTGLVYNLEMGGAKTYTVNGVAVHNCENATKNGHKIYVDTGVQCRHAGWAEAKIPGDLKPLELI